MSDPKYAAAQARIARLERLLAAVLRENALLREREHSRAQFDLDADLPALARRQAE